MEINPSENGHAHRNQQIIPNTLYSYNENHVDGEYKNPYLAVDPRHPDKPLILFDHFKPDLEVYFNKFPIGKIIVIRFSQKMIPLLHGNLFYKTTMEHNYAKKGSNAHWESVKEINDYLKPYKLPSDVPDELIQRLIRSTAHSYKTEEYFSEKYIPSKEYSDRMYFIDFYDIIFNKSKVLNQLSDITNRPITDFVNNEYDMYLERQHNLINTKLSWIDLS